MQTEPDIKAFLQLFWLWSMGDISTWFWCADFRRKPLTAWLMKPDTTCVLLPWTITGLLKIQAYFINKLLWSIPNKQKRKKSQKLEVFLIFVQTRWCFIATVGMVSLFQKLSLHPELRIPVSVSSQEHRDEQQTFYFKDSGGSRLPKTSILRGLYHFYSDLVSDCLLQQLRHRQHKPWWVWNIQPGV